MATQASNALNEIVRTDGNVSPRNDGPLPIAAKYAEHFHRDGQALRSAMFPEKIEFIDRNERMHAYGKANPFTVRAMVETAQERGWKSLEVRGKNPVFKSMVFVEATTRGIPVSGYNATEKDKEALARRESRQAALADPKVQAFLEAQTNKQQKSAVADYPELEPAFAARAAGLAVIAASVSSQEDQADLAGALNDKLARKIHAGEPMPAIEVRSQHQLQEVERE